VTTRFTRAGKRVLGRARRLAIVARPVFIPRRQPAVKSQRRFTLTGH
jgi:hypothetical protein